MLLLYVNLVAGGIAAAVYALVALFWVRHGNWGLAILNLAVASAPFGFGVFYIILFLTHNEPPNWTLVRPIFPLLLLGPAITRFFELVRKERSERAAVALLRKVRT